MSETTAETTAPTDPAEPPAAPPEAPAAPSREEQQPETDQLPPWARESLSKANAEAARYRTAAKTAADEAKASLVQELGRALGLVKDEPIDPAQLTEQLTASQQAAQAAQRELAIYKAAQAKGADPNALLDSRSFMERAATADDAAALDALIGEHLSTNPRFKVTQAAASGGADLGPGGQATSRVYTADQLADHDFYMKNRADILAAQREGRIRI